MPTDPVQVVAEAPCVHRSEGPCHPFHRDYKHPECIVAALKAAGALMPDMAEQMLDSRDKAIVYWVGQVDARDVRLDEVTALLQEALSVLGRLLSTPWSAYDDYYAGPEEVGTTRHTKACEVLEAWNATRRDAASLAEKIEKAIGGEG